MPRVSQSLVEFALDLTPRPQPGCLIDATEERVVRLRPSWPIPGPNHVSRVRCTPRRAERVIDEARLLAARHRLPLMWVEDPGTEPKDLGRRLRRRGVEPDHLDPEVTVMVLPAEARLEAAPGVEFQDGLGSLETFALAEALQQEAFIGVAEELPLLTAQRRQRYQEALATEGRRLLLALAGGRPAGMGWLTVEPGRGAWINGGGVRPDQRGRGVYRSLVAERLRLAREQGAPGLAVSAGRMSGPILRRLGFEPVGWNRFYADYRPAGGPEALTKP
ncbi:MAG TPA: GNAT family N-acetyltransferase [Candidatus Acidoferrales bacterium]|nr:GNAT family N-acetyltransferase [Candidatus Acidoferrales bacterium]